MHSVVFDNAVSHRYRCRYLLDLDHFNGAESCINCAEVRNVVAEIAHRRLEKWANPDCIDAERGDALEILDDARQVAQAISIAVFERARVDLIDDRRFTQSLRWPSSGGDLQPWWSSAHEETLDDFRVRFYPQARTFRDAYISVFNLNRIAR